MRTREVNQAFRLVEGNWLHRKSRQIRFFFGKRAGFHHSCATWNEQPSNIKTMPQPNYSVYSKTNHWPILLKLWSKSSDFEKYQFLGWILPGSDLRDKKKSYLILHIIIQKEKCMDFKPWWSDRILIRPNFENRIRPYLENQYRPHYKNRIRPKNLDLQPRLRI